jgi:hypothetical protein
MNRLDKAASTYLLFCLHRDEMKADRIQTSPPHIHGLEDLLWCGHVHGNCQHRLLRLLLRSHNHPRNGVHISLSPNPFHPYLRRCRNLLAHCRLADRPPSPSLHILHLRPRCGIDWLHHVALPDRFIGRRQILCTLPRRPRWLYHSAHRPGLGTELHVRSLQTLGFRRHDSWFR